ncbi:hypothetical protein BKD09_42900 [Bradyrhizobium japonicum]|uniref:Uncharacterized protein n=2 Tax=Nitrobacteraceae TaxID=41294 RepID=A0A1L3FP79_BRAJP|nr:hypothetical protein BKD09_42900 [Bradyrhizobium japonicum]
MLLFLANVLEQLDLALEHLSKGDVNNARFGVMLTDNALELVLHQIAKDKASELKSFSFRGETYEHQEALDKALGRTFPEKVAFARLTGEMTEEIAQTVLIMHGVRNEVYHAGLQHEAILPSLAVFYFDVVCGFLNGYRPLYFGWSSGQRLPDRSKKYFKGHPSFPGEIEDFGRGCGTLSAACAHNSVTTVATLADHLDEIIQEQDTCIKIVADGVYENQRTTRDQAVVDCQTWPLAFSQEAMAFAQKRGFSGNRLEFVEWLGKNYPLKAKRDPIQRWAQRADKLRMEKNPHSALRHYKAFIMETERLREWILEAADACEREIDAAIDRARGK